MGIADWIVFGLVVGVVGQGMMSGRDPLGTALLGFIGVIGVLFGQAAGWHSEGESLGFLIAVAATVVLVPVHRALSRRLRHGFHS